MFKIEYSKNIELKNELQKLKNKTLKKVFLDLDFKL
jgi:hypothetical protein